MEPKIGHAMAREALGSAMAAAGTRGTFNGQSIQNQEISLNPVTVSAELPAHLAQVALAKTQVHAHSIEHYKPKSSHNESEEEEEEDKENKGVTKGSLQKPKVSGVFKSMNTSYYKKRLPNFNIARLKQLIIKFSQHEPSEVFITGQKLLDETASMFKDVSEQSAALECAKEYFADNPEAQNLKEGLIRANNELLEQSGPEVRAGFNTTLTAIDFSENIFTELAQKGFKTLATSDDLREFYRSAVLGNQNISTMYSAITQNFGEHTFVEAINFLERSLAKDLEAYDPITSGGSSIEPEKLLSTRGDLYSIVELKGIHENIELLLTKVKNTWGLQPKSTAFDMMDRVLKLTQEPFVRKDMIDEIPERFGFETDTLQHTEDEIHFLNEIYRTVLDPIPEKIYPLPEYRTKLKEKFKELLDDVAVIESDQPEDDSVSDVNFE